MFEKGRRESIGHRTINGIIIFTLLLTIAVLNKNRDASPDELLKNVNEAIDEFVGEAPQFDDITMLAFRFNGKQ